MNFSAVNLRIKFVREFLYLSPGDFAHYLGVTEAQVLAVEKPDTEIPANILMVLLQKMNVSADWILTGQGAVFTQSGPIRFPNRPEQVPDKVLRLDEAELDGRIQQLEKNIQTETSLPLEQIRVLFARLLHLEIEPKLTGQKEIGSYLQHLSFFEKAAYYQELQRQVQAAHQQFLRYFSELVAITDPGNAES